MRHNSGYEQAYLSERDKLVQNIAAYKMLALENERLIQENNYYKQKLLPGYDCVFRRQEQEIEEVQRDARDSEAKNLEYDRKSRAEAEEHQSMVERLRVQDQRIKELEARDKGLETRPIEPSDISCLSPDRLQSPKTSKRQRSGRSGQDMNTQGQSEPGKKSRKCKQAKLNESQE
jgi:hypothetical protein